MHARQLAELAAVAALQGSTLIFGSQRLSAGGMREYWLASGARQDRWTTALTKFSHATHRATDAETHAGWRTVRPVLQEIVVSELLTHIWTAVVASHERQRGEDEAFPIAHNVRLRHLEARRRVFQLLAGGRGIPLAEAGRLHRFRHRVERWTDQLLALLPAGDDVTRCAFNAARLAELTTHFRKRNCLAIPEFEEELLASLRQAFSLPVAEKTARRSPNGDLNRRLADSVLACFPAAVTDSTGLLRAVWLKRLARTTHDTEEMLETLIG